MIKILGGLIIFLSMTALGLKKSVVVEKRLDILNEFEKSLVLLKGEIKYSAASLPESVLSVSNRTNGMIRDFYKNVCETILNSPEVLFSKVWEDECRKTFSLEEINQEDLSLIIDLGSQLGHLDVDMQIKNIELCINRLKERQLDATEDIKNKSKLYKTLGISGGALLTLSLL